MTSGQAGRDRTGPGDWLRGLVVLGPHAGAHRVAIRAGISVLVPLLVLLAIGRLEWSLYASFGAFTSLYGRNASYVPRLRMQLTVGALLVASVLLGVLVALVPERAWLVVTLGAVWAVLMSVASDVGRWAPPGPMFLVFAFGAVASAPSTPGSVPTAFVVATASAVFSVLVGVGGALVAGRPRRLLERTPGERAFLRAALRDRALVVRAARFGVAAFLAGALATAVGIGHPYWAMLSAVVPLVASDLSRAVLRGPPRRRHPRGRRARAAAAPAASDRTRRDPPRRRAPGDRRAARAAQLRPRAGLHHPARARHDRARHRQRPARARQRPRRRDRARLPARAPRRSAVLAARAPPRRGLLGCCGWLHSLPPPTPTSSRGSGEFRRGSLFEPVAGERFDHIVSNPPFVITPRTEGVPAYEYRDGGMVGDALVEAVVRGAAEHLTPGGIAQLLGNWEYRADGDGLSRVERWIDGAGLDAWVIERDSSDAAGYAETWIRDGGTRPGTPEFERLYAAWLDDFAARGVSAVGFGYLTLRAPGEGTAPLRKFERLPGAIGENAAGLGTAVDAALAAHDWQGGRDDAALLASVLTVAPDVTEERSYWPGQPDPAVITLRQGSGFGRSVPVDTATAGLVGASDGELSVGAIVSALAQLLGVDEAALTAQLVPVVRQLVVDGFLRHD